MIRSNTISARQTLRSVFMLSGMKTLGSRIAHYRTAAGLSQASLAKACGWASQSRVGNYERDTREPTLEDIATIAKALGVSASQLMTGEKPKAEANADAARTTKSSPTKPSPPKSSPASACSAGCSGGQPCAGGAGSASPNNGATRSQSPPPSGLFYAYCNFYYERYCLL